MMKNKTNEIINFRGILVKISYRRVKNINIYVRPGLREVLVTVPLRADEKKILSVLEEKESWIRVHLTAADSIAQKTNDSPTREQIEILGLWIHEFARKWEPIMNVHCNRWTIRDMTTRWGSCSILKKTIRINAQLAKYPKECCECIVVHELNHLLEPSHNERFHNLMRSFLPDYKEREKLLRKLAKG